MIQDILSVLMGKSIVITKVSDDKCEMRVGKKIEREKIKVILVSALRVALV